MIDHVCIEVIAGSGGNGCVSFRREKYVPRGGPDGGNGGNGGSVVVVADPSVSTLRKFSRRRIHRGQRGVHGKGGGRNGRRGEDTVLSIPVGTEVRVRGEKALLGDLQVAGQTLVVARGGLGGRGNGWFARADYQAPRIAQRGQTGQAVEVELDLKLLADVGIVGLPNVGKSTLLRAISAARPRVGDYPFTTQEPALGVVDVGFETFVVADIPGLIADAHKGAGLGLEFLRHVERTRVLVHILDGGRADPLLDRDAVNRELCEYSATLAHREQLLVVNKIDLEEVKTRREALEHDLASQGLEAQFVSAAERRGTEELARRMAQVLSSVREDVVPEPAPVLRPKPLERRFQVDRQGDGFRVGGERVVAFAEMMPVESEEGRQELWWRLGRWGVSAALRRAGARPGARVRLGELELDWPG